MEILIEEKITLNYFREFFDYNLIDYRTQDFWSIADSQANIYEHLVPINLTNTLLILEVETVLNILQCDLATVHLTNFLSSNNILWVASQLDMSINVLRNSHSFTKLDTLQNNKNIVLWLDSELTFDLNFKNTQINTRYYTFLKALRIKKTKTIKNNDSKNFLLTVITKNPARKMLVEKINKRKIFLENSIIHAVSKKTYDNWIGDPGHNSDCYEHFPSMDLYNNVWLEIVPETSVQDHYFITEKTFKPISTKTPFLILSTPGYLKYLRSLGFKTFNHLVDESYDNELDLDTRIKKMLDVLEDIVKNGARQFYEECCQTLDYNFDKLCEQTTKKQFLLDELICTWLEAAEKQLTLP